MMGDAVESEALTLIRTNVPEFEDVFQAELRSEDGELGAFQAMSALAEWILGELNETGDCDVARRVFDSVEHLIVDHNVELGDALAAEFIEATWDNSRALELMGPKTRERATPDSDCRADG